MYQNLIIYSTTDGQTIKICERIQSVIGDSNNSKIISVNNAKNENISKFVNSIYFGPIFQIRLYQELSKNGFVVFVNALYGNIVWKINSRGGTGFSKNARSIKQIKLACAR